jgi:hypothetical protein
MAKKRKPESENPYQRAIQHLNEALFELQASDPPGMGDVMEIHKLTGHIDNWLADCRAGIVVGRLALECERVTRERAAIDAIPRG